MRIRLRFSGSLSVPIAYHQVLQRSLYSLVPDDMVRAWRAMKGFRPFTVIECL
ncbi:hypothetical protein [Sulfobacillus thermosulfidooxidans]|uniref:hypothetical protein n=1 Tax=Sulfobacillus thermosulfidooxidans TaxID=28034 RepID=UPI000AD64817|nr:hypothetical protein [Sulfobacillus thermosulfidooxidans]